MNNTELPLPPDDGSAEGFRLSLQVEANSPMPDMPVWVVGAPPDDDGNGDGLAYPLQDVSLSPMPDMPPWIANDKDAPIEGEDASPITDDYDPTDLSVLAHRQITDTTRESTMSCANHLLNHCHRNGSYSYLWTDIGKRSTWFPVDARPVIPKAKRNIYFGVHPVSEIPTTAAEGEPATPAEVRGRSAIVCCINTFFAEFDAKDEVIESEYAPHLPEGFDALKTADQRSELLKAKLAAFLLDPKTYKDRVMRRIAAAPLFPTMLIDSGGGYHSYWFLENTVAVNDANRERIEKMQAAWVDIVGADPGSKDLARVLRVPGTLNMKAHYAPDYPVVSVVEYEAKRQFRFADFEELTGIDEIHEEATRAVARTRQQQSGKLQGSVIAEFNRAHDLVDILTQHSYPLVWRRGNMARLRRPGGNSASVVVFTDSDPARSYHHSSSDPLHCDGKFARDAFDVFTELEYNGDQAKAFEAAKKTQGKWEDKPSKPSIAKGDDGGDDDNENGSGRNKVKQADELFKLVSERAELFTNEDGDRFALVPIDDHRECYGLNSKGFREYLDGLYYSQHKSIPGAQAKQDSIGLLSFHARTKKREAFYRAAMYEGSVYVDLGTDDWSAVEIDASGWRIVKNYPVAFRRSSATKALPIPQPQDDLTLLLKHINISKNDWMLFSSWLVTATMPSIPVPILTFPNEQGTGKTTNTNRAKALLDPGKGRVMPKETRDLMVMTENNWVIAYDNVSFIPPEIADALCQVVTGGEYAKRQNYADKDESIIKVQRPIIINGIGNITSDRPDLMDRALMIRPPVIPADKRIPEKISDAAFEVDRAKIMGALFGEVSRVLRILPSVDLAELPRMADFTCIGYAMHGQEFVKAYMDNIENARRNAADSSPLVEFVTKLAQKGKFEGTATRLLDELNDMEGAEKHKNLRDWPKSNRTVKNAMQRVAPLLRGNGVEVMQTDTKLGSWFVIEMHKSES